MAAMDLAQAPKDLAAHGEVGRGRDRGCVTTSIKGRERGADYLAARIARDRPDILERMKANEYRSVRQAALAAGETGKLVTQ